LGADKVVDYTDTDFAEKFDKYDVILIAVDKLPFAICNRVLNENGVYLNITAPVKSFQMLWTSLTSRKKVIVGESPPEKAEDLDFLKKLVEENIIKPVIDRSFPFEEMVEAHRYVDKGHKKGNVVISMG
jgi:NADPH:quinone reductase-like Zn-dependent oxidoreductase